mgnify:CR=1 FL=1
MRGHGKKWLAAVLAGMILMAGLVSGLTESPAIEDPNEDKEVVLFGNQDETDNMNQERLSNRKHFRIYIETSLAAKGHAQAFQQAERAICAFLWMAAGKDNMSVSLYALGKKENGLITVLERTPVNSENWETIHKSLLSIENDASVSIDKNESNLFRKAMELEDNQDHSAETILFVSFQNNGWNEKYNLKDITNAPRILYLPIKTGVSNRPAENIATTLTWNGEDTVENFLGFVDEMMAIMGYKNGELDQYSPLENMKLSELLEQTPEGMNAVHVRSLLWDDTERVFSYLPSCSPLNQHLALMEQKGEEPTAALEETPSDDAMSAEIQVFRWTQYAPYELSLESPPETIQKGENLSLRGSIKQSPLLSDWMMEVTWSRGNEGETENYSEQIPVDENGNFSWSKKMTVSGDMQLWIRGTSQKTGYSTPEQTMTISVKNSPPTSSVSEELSITLWKNSELLPSDYVTDLSTLFEDTDNYEGNDVVPLKIEVPGGEGISTSREGMKLHIDLDDAEPGDYTLTAKATDLEGQTAEIPIHVRIIDATDALKTGEAKISIDPEQDTPYEKETPLKLSGTYAFSEHGRIYLEATQAAGQEKQLLDMLKGRFTATPFGGEIDAEMTEPEEVDGKMVIHYLAKDSYLTPKAKGDIGLRFTVGDGIIESPPEKRLSISNSAPKLKDKAEHRIKLHVPDPLFGKETVQDKLLLSDYFREEPGDVLDFTITDKTGRLYLYKDGEAGYLLTDVQHGQYAVAEKITWDTEQGAPIVQFALSKQADYDISIHVTDNDGDSAAEDVTLKIVTEWEHRTEIIVGAASILALLILLIAILILRQIKKPSYAVNNKLVIRCETWKSPQEYSISLHPWKKKTITLQDIMPYLAVPSYYSYELKDCKSICLSPGEKGALILRNNDMDRMQLGENDQCIILPYAREARIRFPELMGGRCQLTISWRGSDKGL